ELFFDLVFVAAVGQLANSLAGHPTFPRFLGFVAVFVPVWWAWTGFTFYANRFDTDDLPYRLLTLLAMFFVAVLATTVRSVFGGHSTGFVVAYVCVRLILIVFYVRARRHVPEARGLANTFLVAFAVGAGSGAAAAAGFVAAAALWWIYFDFLDETTVSARGILGGLTFTYMHFFVIVGLAALGAGVKVAILSAGGTPEHGTSWILCAGL